MPPTLLIEMIPPGENVDSRESKILVAVVPSLMKYAEPPESKLLRKPT